MSFDITRKEVSSFDGGFYRPILVHGPITLARFSDSHRGEPGRFGRYWFYGSYIQDLMEQATDRFALIKQISQQWAICDDWGDKMLLSLMDVPPGAFVPAMYGKAKFQPKVHDAQARSTSRSYEGGASQLIIPVTTTDGVRNNALAAMIKRRLFTTQILTNPSLTLENPWVTAQRSRGRNI